MNFGNVGGKRAWLGALVSALMATPFKTISISGATSPSDGVADGPEPL
jgi:hypothetical protein